MVTVTFKIAPEWEAVLAERGLVTSRIAGEFGSFAEGLERGRQIADECNAPICAECMGVRRTLYPGGLRERGYDSGAPLA